MPNGFHGPQEEWEKKVGPLRTLDDRLTRFATKHGMNLVRDYHNTPGRNLEWKEGGLDRLIQVFLDQKEKTGFHFWVAATKDKGGQRYWKNAYLKKGMSFAELDKELEKMLEEGKKIVSGWEERDLELA